MGFIKSNLLDLLFGIAIFLVILGIFETVKYILLNFKPLIILLVYLFIAWFIGKLIRKSIKMLFINKYKEAK